MNTEIPFIRISLTGVLLLGATMKTTAQHPLDSWVQRTVPGTSVNLNSVAYGNGVFVAVGDGSFVARSVDGATWTAAIAGAYGNLTRVRFLNGQFAAVGTSDKILFSADGDTWAAEVLPEANFWDVAFGNGVYVLSGLSTYVSSNGVDWAPTHPLGSIQSPFPPYNMTTFEAAFDTVVFGNGGFLALPTGNPIGFPLLTPKPSFFSTNGVDWVPVAQTFQSSPTAGRGQGELVFEEGRWLATMAGNTANGIPNPGVIVSIDNGLNWCCRYMDESGYGVALAAGEGHYVYVETYGSFPRSWVYSSTNGSSWTRRLQDNAGTANAVAFGAGTFVMVGGTSRVIDSGQVTGSSYIMQSGRVSGAPFIFEQPQDRAALAMNPATLSVQAVGSPPLTYQWYKNGASIPNATNASYSIASVSTSDSGGYQSVIANSFGSVTSRVAQLTVAFLEIHSYAGITVLGVPSRTYQIEATPASGTPNWQTVTNLLLPSSPYIWFDRESPGLPARIYRVSELP